MRTKLKGLNHGWRLFVALALVFSMVPALAVSMAGTAGAVANGAVAYGSDFILDEAGGEGGMARWIWDNIVEPDPPGTLDDFHSSNHSAYLKALNYEDSAMVIVTWGCTIGELTDTELSFWYRTPGEDLGPIMGLAIDTNHDGVPNMYAYVSPQPAGSLAWTQWSEDFVGTHWQILGGGSPVDWTTLVSTAGPDAKVLAVMVGYDYQRNQTEPYHGEALVDDIVVGDPAVNGQSWDLEPIDKDCVKSELGVAFSGNPIQIEVDDISANVEGHEDLELAEPDPDGATSDFNVDHAPKSVGTTSAYDLGGQLTVTAVAQTPTGGTVTVSETPPAYYQVFPDLNCAHAEADMNPSVITLTTPTQLTATSLNRIVDADDTNNPDCDPTPPGAGEWMYIFISGYTLPNGLGTPINELLYILGDTMTTATTTQSFGTIIVEGIDATYSVNSAATALFISAENHVWVTYDWHQHDTVTVFAQTDVEMVEVTCIEVDPITLEPDKDSGYFKGILYPVTTSTNVEPSLIPGLQRHDLLAPHCKTIELKYPENDPQYIFDTFGVDNVPPVFSNNLPYPATNLSLPTISVDISDTKCDVTKEKIHLYVSSVGDNPPFDPGDKVAPANFDFTAGTLTYTPSSPLVDGTYYVRVKAADCCWNWAEIDWDFEVESTPPRMIDAITGWGWYWGYPRGPQNLNLRTTIMVVFSEPLDPTTVEKTDFRVNNITPVDVEYHDYNGDWPGNCGDNSHAYGLVFLHLSTPLATDATPTVKQFGVVVDLAGNPCDKYYTWECPTDVWNFLNDPPPQEVTAQDGIAPAITVTASPEEPGYNETVTVTATSSEDLSEAYLFVGEGSPSDWNWDAWDACKPIGWGLFGADVPCSATGHVPATEWDGAECSTCASSCKHGYWMLMTQGATAKVWTAEFTNEMMPNALWFVEVAAHDNTQWWVDMTEPEDPGVWYDYECVEHEKRWKHEKWTQESFLFGAWGVEFVELCEGWNLISVPWDLVYSSPLALFNVRTNVGVTMVYHYTGGAYGTWQYALLNPLTGMWTGTITAIVPGKAYWVWVSPPRMELVLHILPPDPMTPPKTVSLKKGYNMLGYVEMADRQGAGTDGGDDGTSNMRDNLDMRFYFVSIEDQATHMYAYDPCEVWYDTGRGFNPWIRFDSGPPTGYGGGYKWHYKEMRVGCGYWLFVTEDILFAP